MVEKCLLPVKWWLMLIIYIKFTLDVTLKLIPRFSNRLLNLEAYDLELINFRDHYYYYSFDY